MLNLLLMSKINRTDRRSIAEKIMELGNLFVGGFIITTIISNNEGISIKLVGVALLITFYTIAIIILQRK